MIFSLIGSIITGALGIGKSHLESKQRVREAEQANTAKLLNDEASHNSSWEMANLQDKDKWMRRGSFLMFAGPFIWALFDPAQVGAYFAMLTETMPEWYVQTFMSMIGGIWGISALKNTVPGLIQGVVGAIKKK